MTHTRFRMTMGLSLILVLAPMLGIAQAGEAPPSEAVRPLERIAVVDAGDRVRVEVESGRPVAYSMATSEAPASVAVELPGFSKGTGLQRMEINKPPLLQMIPSEVSQPRQAVQLSFLLTATVKPDIRMEGSKLIIDFQKTRGGAESEARAQAQPNDDASGASQTPPAPALRASGQATVMNKVEVQRGDGEATVIILGDGEFTYDVRALKQDRLVVDLSHVSSPLRFQILPVDHPLLKQIRVGHHSDRVRLVFDLPQPVHYEVQPGKTQLAVRLTSGGTGTSAGMPESGATVTEPRAAEQSLAKRRESEQGRVRVAKAGRVPFPERLAQLEERPALAQMAPEVKESEDQPEPIGERKFVGRRISLDFQQADIQNVFRLLAEVSGLNMVIGEGVKGKVTMRLLNVPWDQALDMLLKMNNLGKIRSGNIIWIDTMANVTKQQEEEAKAKEAKAKAEDLITRIIYVRNVQASEIQNSLRQYLSPRGQLTLNAGGNALVVQDTASRVAAFKELVDLLDVEVPQIQIEARIVQADTSYSRGFGVQWGVQDADFGLSGGRFKAFGNLTGDFAPLAGTGATTQPRTFIVNLPAAVSGLSTVPGVGFTMGKLTPGFALDARLSAGEVLGLAKVIAAPKITTLDKRQAKISQGESIPFQTTSLQGTQTTFVDANLELSVTPQITSRDPNEPAKQILMQIKATRNAVGARSNPAGPSIDKREANTQVLVRDGETAVIGGVFVDSQTNNVAGTPYLSRIPVLGWLFKNKSETVAKQELLIFLTPFIVKS
ncbi:MAG: type IV pilus secretin PilQ [Nitrospira sp.]|nr:type IV pilus secretin PilQ [Nitrospira sp.]